MIITKCQGCGRVAAETVCSLCKKPRVCKRECNAVDGVCTGCGRTLAQIEEAGNELMREKFLFTERNFIQ